MNCRTPWPSNHHCEAIPGLSTPAFPNIGDSSSNVEVTTPDPDLVNEGREQTDAVREAVATEAPDGDLFEAIDDDLLTTLALSQHAM